MTSSNKKRNTVLRTKINAKNKNQHKKSLNQQSEDKSSKTSETGSIFPSVDVAFKAFLSARCCSAIWSHITDCDETYNYWEPSHFLIYGKGFQTWEYNPNYGLRSYMYLLLHVAPAWIYANLLQPNRMLIFYFIRCLLGLVCALCETYFYKAVHKTFGNLVGGLVVAFLVFSPGMFISCTAFLPSSFSMYACLLSTGAWLNGKFELAIFASALSVFISWPFYALIAVPLALDILFVKKQYGKFIKWSIISTLVNVVPMIKIDSELYGRFVAAPVNIVLYNVFSKHGSALYGTEPFSFYFINGFLNFNVAFIFALLAPFAILARNYLLASLKKTKLMFYSWLHMSPFYIWFIVFTFQPHKEERFLFPVYPLICLCGAIGISSLYIIFTELRFKYRGKLFEYISKTHIITCVIVSLTIILGVSRIFALYKGYHAPMDIYMEFNKLYAESRVSENSQINVCVGKEWHRFPNSFFLPSDNWNLKFLKSEFKGQLPAEYTRSENATAIVHSHFNDMNLEEVSRYFNVGHCHFLVDYDNGIYSDLEPNYSRQKDKWKVFSSLPFLNSEKSDTFFRAFYVPFLSEIYTNYSDYNLLISTKFQLKDSDSKLRGKI